MLDMRFTGQQTANNQARLEAFLYQARAYDAGRPVQGSSGSSVGL